jgi:rod shape determining protein RodA
MFSRLKKQIDWTLLLATVPLLGAGLLTMSSFAGENYYFTRQVMWIVISLVVCVGASFVDWRFLKRGGLLALLFLGMCGALTGLFLVGTVRGVQSWVQLGSVSVQPADFAKLLVIIILAKYFSRRHIEIANIRHILVSGMYAFIPFALVFLQPDFGSAVIIAAIWLGMVMVSGVSKKHLGAVFSISVVAFAGLWLYVFAPYQKARIMTFLNPLADVRGAGYNANQAQIAVGSGQMWGKGVGFGTQSRLKFLPEYQTDFVFAAYAEVGFWWCCSCVCPLWHCHLAYS